jgi:hypothetical protein
MAITLDLEDGPLNIICAYAPQVGCSAEEKEVFWNDFEQLLEKFPDVERRIVTGDLNGHVGSDRSGAERSHGGFGFGTRNDEGETILDVCLANDLAVVNTFFPKRHNQLVTYKSGGNETQIDYLLVNRRLLNKVTDCSAIPGEAATAQHRLVVMNMKLGKKMKALRATNGGRIKWWRLQGQRAVEFERRMREWLLVNPPHDVQTSWEGAAAKVREVATDILGVTKDGKYIDKETWFWNDEVQQAAKTKKEAFKRWQLTNSPVDKTQAKLAKKACKRVVARSKAAKTQDLYLSLETKEGEKEIYKLARSREKATRDMGAVRMVKDVNGKVLRDPTEVRARWGDYNKTLLNEENTREELPDTPPANSNLVARIMEDDVKEALRRMKNKKATGPDDIAVEAWKVCGNVGVIWLTGLLNQVMREEEMPNAWRKSTTVSIYKRKGDVLLCQNYRGIKLLAHTMKLFERILDSRLRKECSVSQNQFGFVPNSSTTDAIFALRILMEKHREKQVPLHMVFLDMEKAFDRVPRDVIWWALRKKKVPEIYVRCIQEMYAGATTRVLTPVGASDELPVTVGVHQGSALSPYLFVVVMDVICGNCGEAPWTMLYADDVVITTTDRDSLQSQLQGWKDRLEKFGLKLSLAKTEYLATGIEASKPNSLYIDGVPIKKVQQFKYLGSVVHANGDIEQDVNNRKQAGWLRFRSVSGVLCDRKMPLKLKGKVYRTVVRPALLYGSECWPTNARHEQSLHVTEMRMLRMACGVTRLDRLRNDHVRGSLKVAPIASKAQESRLRWYGHILRRDEENIGRNVLDMEVGGKRRRGRPKTRWRDVIVKDMAAKGVTVVDAQDRIKWRSMTRNADP